MEGVGAAEGVPVGEVVAAGETPDGVMVGVDATPEGTWPQPASSTAIAATPTTCFSEEAWAPGNSRLMLIERQQRQFDTNCAGTDWGHYITPAATLPAPVVGQV